MRRILLWEEDEREEDILIALLEDEYRVLAVRDEKTALAALRNGSWESVVLGVSGNPTARTFRSIHLLKAASNSIPILCRLPNGDPAKATRLIYGGASACVSQTCPREELKAWLREIKGLPCLERAGAAPDSKADKSTLSLPLLLGESEAMRHVRSQIELFARYDFPVLITGECGTGKDLAAKSIHRLSGRASAPFLPINCGAIPETILESELFGTERGAYTGAVSRPGNFELAQGGILFLDEVTELAGGAQAKLLRALEDGEIRRLGARKTLRCDVRILSATNADLESLVGAVFRYDLLERLETLVLEIPPLRERLEDIPLLSQHFLDLASIDSTLSEEALEELRGYDWPGNVRQLRNTILRAAVMASDSTTGACSKIQAEHIRFGRRPRGSAWRGALEPISKRG